MTEFRSFTSLCYAFLRGETPPHAGTFLRFGCTRSHVFGDPVLDPAMVRWGDDSPCSELVAEAFKRGRTADEVQALVRDVQDYVGFAERGGLVDYRKDGTAPVTAGRQSVSPTARSRGPNHYKIS